MKWQAFKPLEALQHLVDSYWVYEQEAEAEVKPQLVLPSPTPALMLPYAAVPPLVAPATGQAAAWRCRPVSHRRLELCCGPGQGLFGITFQPTGFYQLFGVSMTAACQAGPELAGRAGRFVQDLGACLLQAATAHERANAAERLLLAAQAQGELPTGAESLAAAMLLRQSQLSIDALAAQANLCRRQFERRFREVVGTSPKLFAEISRFHHVVQQLDAQPLVNWQDVTYACGYFDQAHLIKEFRRFSGETPGAYSAQL